MSAIGLVRPAEFAVRFDDLEIKLDTAMRSFFVS
jgi:hypothetical protein